MRRILRRTWRCEYRISGLSVNRAHNVAVIRHRLNTIKCQTRLLSSSENELRIEECMSETTGIRDGDKSGAKRGKRNARQETAERDFVQ